MYKKLIALLIAANMLSVPVFAASQITTEPDNELIVVSGSIDTDVSVKEVSVIILKPGKTFDDITQGDTSAVAFAGQVPVRANGEYKIKAKISGDSGIYTVYSDYIGNDNNSGQTVKFIKTADSLEALGKLFAATSDAGVKAVLTDADDWFNLNIDNEFYANLSVDRVSKILYSIIKAEYNADEMSPTVELAQEYFDKTCAIEAVKEGYITDIETYYDLLGISSDNKAVKYHNPERTAREAEFYRLIQNMDYSSPEQFVSAYEEATVLATVRYSDGSGQVKNVISDFSSQIGIANVSTLSSVYSTLSGNQYDSYFALKTAYDAAVSKAQQSGNGAASSRPTGGGSSASVPSGGNAGTASPTPVDQTIVTKGFTDIADVTWAVNAIKDLYNRGVVSGKSDTEFAPNDSVTREEFVTMLVRAFGFKATDKLPEFADVSADDWFYENICIAYGNEIVNGMDGVFGVGSDITRQDMAVMVYNCLKAKEKELETSAETEEFSDSGDIADYAAEAVAYLQSAGIINGMGDGTFSPRGTCTRAQAAVVISGVLNQ